MPQIDSHTIRWTRFGHDANMAGEDAPVQPGDPLAVALATAYNAAQAPEIVIPDPVPVTPTPAPVTPTPTAPPLPPLTRKVAPAQTDADGITFRRGEHAALLDVHVEGYGQNIVAQNVPSLAIDNVRTVRAYSNAQFDGQGLYVDAVPGDVEIKNFYSRANGWQPGRPTWQLGPNKHGGYIQFGVLGRTLIDTAIIADISQSGLELRGAGGIIRNAVILNCGIGVALVQGGWRLEHCTIYDGNYYVDPGPGGKVALGAWTANMGICSWCPVDLDDVWIVGRPGQERPPLIPPAKCYPMGAVSTSRKWPGAGQPNHQAYRVTGGVVNATNCVIAGWPMYQPNKGQPTNFAGDLPGNGAGFLVKPNAAEFEYAGILNSVESNSISIAAAVEILHAAIRGAVK